MEDTQCYLFHLPDRRNQEIVPEPLRLDQLGLPPPGSRECPRASRHTYGAKNPAPHSADSSYLNRTVSRGGTKP